MKQIEAAVFDVDGTLYDYHDGKIHDSTVDAICRLKKRGVTVIIASSRAYPELSQECIERIGADYYVTASGHSVQDSVGRSIFAERFSCEQTELLVSLARKFGAGLTLKYDTYLCMYSQPEEMKKVFTNIGPNCGAGCRYCPSMDYHAGELPLGFTIRGENGIRDQICEELKKYPLYFRMELYRNGVVADIYHPQSNKMTALTYLTRRLGFSAEKCIAFGDGGNDVQMIKWAGIGIAMGNAREELKEVADRVCGASWEDGIATMLEELNLI